MTDTAGGLAIGVDIGGTKVAAGVVDTSGAVIARARRATPSRHADARVVEATIADVVDELRQGREITGVGIGAAGFVDADRARVLFAPHLAWRNEPLRDGVAAAVGLPVVVENDANAAAWAEWRFGAGRAESRLVMVTLGTGIGGGMVFDGVIQRGRYGMAGEFGHMVVVPDGRRCECGNRGCLEQYASGNVLGREAREMAAAGSPVTVPLVQRVKGDHSALVGPLITEAAMDGDPAAVELFHEVGNWLGIGLANLAAALDPGLFVIGGGVSDADDLLLAPARASFRRTLTGRGFRPFASIVKADLGPEAGLVGAADLARRQAAALAGE
ncbi:ROK family glucokinase [Kineosporia mesophila]|uniref:Glucokinase n=1 Tax=Kineosporia mesophila TaxID=566012 RepID=A0ABP7A6W1_9ACTN|nr:ROK family glucokinase [Kineosporia mesophila]